MLLDKLNVFLEEDQLYETNYDPHPLGNSGFVTVYPRTEEEISMILEQITEKEKTVTVVGGGSKQGFGGLTESSDVLLSLAQYKGIVEHSPGDLTLVVKSGTTIKEINDYLHKYNQMLPIDAPLPEFATIGGVVAANDSGPKRFKYGSLRDNVLGLRMVDPNGKVIRTGGKVVKNVAGYDMNKLYIGSMGTLGVISEVTLKLRPIPNFESLVLLHFSVHNEADLNGFIKKLLDSTIEPTTIELLNGTLSLHLTGRYANTLAIHLSDVEKAVIYQESWLKNERPANVQIQMIRNDEAIDWWGKFSLLYPKNALNIEFSSKEIVSALKISSKTSDVTKIVFFLDQLADKYNISIKSNGGIGHGITRVYFKAQLDDLLKVIEEIRSFVIKLSGYAIVTHLPLFVRKQIDIWGESPTYLPILKAIKHQIDPKHLMNRHRFIGGI